MRNTVAMSKFVPAWKCSSLVEGFRRRFLWWMVEPGPQIKSFLFVSFHKAFPLEDQHNSRSRISRRCTHNRFLQLCFFRTGRLSSLETRVLKSLMVLIELAENNALSSKTRRFVTVIFSQSCFLDWARSYSRIMWKSYVLFFERGKQNKVWTSSQEEEPDGTKSSMRQWLCCGTFSLFLQVWSRKVGNCQRVGGTRDACSKTAKVKQTDVRFHEHESPGVQGWKCCHVNHSKIPGTLIRTTHVHVHLLQECAVELFSTHSSFLLLRRAKENFRHLGITNLICILTFYCTFFTTKIILLISKKINEKKEHKHTSTIRRDYETEPPERKKHFF